MCKVMPVMQAASAAGMQVVAIPSLADKQAYRGCKCTILASLLDFLPSDFGLQPFTDFVEGTVPLCDPWRIKGPVVKGFGRGSKVRDPAALSHRKVDAWGGVPLCAPTPGVCLLISWHQPGRKAAQLECCSGIRGFTASGESSGGVRVSHTCVELGRRRSRL